MNFKQRLVIIIMDILILVELVLSIYLSSRTPEYQAFEYQAAIFMRTYLPMLITTLVLARIFYKRFRTDEPLGVDRARFSKQ
jgi:hypothetical protein